MVVNDLDGALYCADGGMTQEEAMDEPPFIFKDDVLHCTGVIIDRIATILGEIPFQSTSDMKFPLGDPPTHLKYTSWMKAVQDLYAESNTNPYDDTIQAAKAMFHGDVPSAWPRREDNPDNCSDQYPDEKYVCNPELSRHIKYFAGSYSRLEARDTVKMTLRGRTLCVTEKGYMALAPSYINTNTDEKPWLLAILATCSVPVVLQENDDGSYRVHGSCFVQGWMEGEILKTEFGVDEQHEFWSIMRGGSHIALR